jgi:PKD repeat protein
MRLVTACLMLLSSAAFAGTPPTIVSTGSDFAVLGQPYHYNELDQVVATGDAPLSWTVSTPPPGFAIDPTTGKITWTPSMAGDVVLAITATNASGMDAQMVSVHVAAPPTIVSTPTTSGQVGVSYLYGTDGTIHVNGDPPVTFKATTAPSGFVVDAASGQITWTPAQVGSFPVTLVAQSSFGSAMQSFTVNVIAGGGNPPMILHDANLAAAVGLAYVYDAGRAIQLSGGDAPVTFSVVSGPPELFVDPRAGSVAWIPAAAGMQTVTVRAANLAGVDDYTFTVNVADGVTAMPAAAANGAPLVGEAPLDVAFSSDGSSAGGDATLISTEWDFGDGSPPDRNPNPSHTYRLAGSYTARLTVTNSYGASATSPVSVTATLGGAAPPRAHAVASPTSGQDVLTVQFTCDCTAGTNPITHVRWDFADGSQSASQNPMHTFLPGRYLVRLTVADVNGMTGQDSVVITVNAGTKVPPLASAYAAPPAGPAPLAVSFLATAVDLNGYITDLHWDFGDGTGASAVDHVQKTFEQAGTYNVVLVATSDTGLTATAPLTVVVTANDAVPPDILTVPKAVAYVGVPYKYGDSLPAARGSRPLTWSLGDGAPAGLTVHSETGELIWTPTADQIGPVTIKLVASNAAASTTQTFTVTVQPASAAPAGGCDLLPAADRGAVPSALLLVVLLALARLWRYDFTRRS